MCTKEWLLARLTRGVDVGVHCENARLGQGMTNVGVECWDSPRRHREGLLWPKAGMRLCAELTSKSDGLLQPL